jgi:hypothetical protein
VFEGRTKKEVEKTYASSLNGNLRDELSGRGIDEPDGALPEVVREDGEEMTGGRMEEELGDLVDSRS